MSSVSRIGSFFLVSLLGAACSSMYGAHISVSQPEGASAFTQQEQDRVKAIVVEIGRAERFSELAPLPMRRESSSYEYLTFVRLTGKDSEQDTVDVLGSMRQDRREIVISIGDDYRDTPLPRTQKLVDDLHAALRRAFPDSRVEVATRKTPRIFGP